MRFDLFHALTRLAHLTGHKAPEIILAEAGRGPTRAGGTPGPPGAAGRGGGLRDAGPSGAWYSLGASRLMAASFLQGAENKREIRGEDTNERTRRRRHEVEASVKAPCI